jgi:hypothetical protein
VVRVLREWVLARSAPASPLARACALHLLCRDAGVLQCCRDAGDGWAVCVLDDTACGYACVRGLRACFSSLRSRKPARVCLVRCICCAGMLPCWLLQLHDVT